MQLRSGRDNLSFKKRNVQIGLMVLIQIYFKVWVFNGELIF